jgi:hypothetical protein
LVIQSVTIVHALHVLTLLPGIWAFMGAQNQLEAVCGQELLQCQMLQLSVWMLVIVSNDKKKSCDM